MALKTSKCNHRIPLRIKGLRSEMIRNRNSQLKLHNHIIQLNLIESQQPSWTEKSANYHILGNLTTCLSRSYNRVSNRSAGMISRIHFYENSVEFAVFFRNDNDLLGMTTNPWDHTDPVYMINSSVNWHLPGTVNPNIKLILVYCEMLSTGRLWNIRMLSHINNKQTNSARKFPRGKTVPLDFQEC